MGKGRRDGTKRALDETGLREMGMSYVARFATTGAKLRTYLIRKLRERDWTGESDPDVEAVVGRMVELGLVDDRAFAEARSRSLLSRGYGERRVSQALAAAGVAEEDRREAQELAREKAMESALRYARKRRLGPFADEPSIDPKRREKAMAAMIRAGHGFEVARIVLQGVNNKSEH